MRKGEEGKIKIKNILSFESCEPRVNIHGDILINKMMTMMGW